jgi:hypothetical protein
VWRPFGAVQARCGRCWEAGGKVDMRDSHVSRSVEGRVRKVVLGYGALTGHAGWANVGWTGVGCVVWGAW